MIIWYGVSTKFTRINFPICYALYPKIETDKPFIVHNSNVIKNTFQMTNTFSKKTTKN